MVTSQQILFSFFVLVCICFLSCNQRKLKKYTGDDTFSQNDTVIQTGKDLYARYCLSCHQTDGSGVPGMYPPLADTEGVKGHKERLIKSVLFGVKGKIEINGTVYNQEMPPQYYLTDEEIASILTYVRYAFGSGSSAVFKPEVADIRQKGKN